MQKLVLFIAAIAAGLLLSVYAWREGWLGDAGTAIRSELQFDERSPELRNVELQALGGSIKAANALMDYHSKCHKREQWNPSQAAEELRRCSAKVRYWTAIALENGSLPAAQRHTNALLGSEKCRDIYRAEFWFHKFSGHFNSDQVFLESVRNEIEDKKKNCTW